MSFDPKCFDLAAAFLADHPAINTEAAKTTLASAIQASIEDEIEFMLSVIEPTPAGAK